MNTDFRVQLSFYTHPKKRKLEKRIGKAACFCLTELWAFTAFNKPDGILQDMTIEDIEIAADWNGDPGLFVSTLIDLRLLNNDGKTYRIHDWLDHNAYASGAGERSKQGALGAAVKDANRQGLTGEEREAFINSRLNRFDNEFKSSSSGVEVQLTDSSTPSPAPTPTPAPSPSPVPPPAPIADILSAKSADGIKKPAVKGNGEPKPYIPIEQRKANTPGAKLVKYWHVRYEQIHRVKYSGDIVRMGGQSATLVKRNTAEDLAAGVNFLLSSTEHEQYHPHTWDHFVKNASKYILEAKDANYEPGFFID